MTIIKPKWANQKCRLADHVKEEARRLEKFKGEAVERLALVQRSEYYESVNDVPPGTTALIKHIMRMTQ